MKSNEMENQFTEISAKSLETQENEQENIAKSDEQSHEALYRTEKEFADSNNQDLNYEKALGFYQKALEHAKENRQMAGGLPAEEMLSEAYNNVGEIYFKLNNSTEAISMFNAAIEIEEKLMTAVKNETNNPENDYNKNYCRSYINLGLAYLQQKDYKNAFSSIDSAGLVANNRLAVFGRDIDSKALKDCSQAMGDYYWAITDYKTAVAYYQAACDIARKLYDKLQSSSAKLEFATALMKTADSIRILNGNSASVSLYEESLHLFEEISAETDTKQSYSDLVSISKRLYDIYIAEDDKEKAIEMARLQGLFLGGLEKYQDAQQMLKTAVSLGDLFIDTTTDAEFLKDYADDCNIVAKEYETENKYELAATYYEKEVAVVIKMVQQDLLEIDIDKLILKIAYLKNIYSDILLNDAKCNIYKGRIRQLLYIKAVAEDAPQKRILQCAKELYDYGKICFADKNYNEANAFLIDATSGYQKIYKTEKSVEIYEALGFCDLWRGRIYEIFRNYETAIRFFDNVVSYSEYLADNVTTFQRVVALIEGYHLLSKAYRLNDDSKNARTYLEKHYQRSEKADKEYNNSETKMLMAICNENGGDYFDYTKDYDDAGIYYRKAAKYIEDLIKEEDTAERNFKLAELQLKQGIVVNKNNKHDRNVIRHFNEYERILHDFAKRENTVSAYEKLAEGYERLAITMKPLQYFSKELMPKAILEKLVAVAELILRSAPTDERELEVARVSDLLGDTLVGMGGYDNAIPHYQRSYNIHLDHKTNYETIENLERYSASCKHLGDAYLYCKVSEHDKAVFFYSERLKTVKQLSRQKNNDAGYQALSRGYEDMSAVLFELKEYNKCIEKLLEAVAIHESRGEWQKNREQFDHTIKIYKNCAFVYGKLRNKAEVSKYEAKAENISKRANSVLNAVK